MLPDPHGDKRHSHSRWVRATVENEVIQRMKSKKRNQTIVNRGTYEIKLRKLRTQQREHPAKRKSICQDGLHRSAFTAYLQVDRNRKIPILLRVEGICTLDTTKKLSNFKFQVGSLIHFFFTACLGWAGFPSKSPFIQDSQLLKQFPIASVASPVPKPALRNDAEQRDLNEQSQVTQSRSTFRLRLLGPRRLDPGPTATPGMEQEETISGTQSLEIRRKDGSISERSSKSTVERIVSQLSDQNLSSQIQTKCWLLERLTHSSEVGSGDKGAIMVCVNLLTVESESSVKLKAMEALNVIVPTARQFDGRYITVHVPIAWLQVGFSECELIRSDLVVALGKMTTDWNARIRELAVQLLLEVRDARETRKSVCQQLYRAYTAYSAEESGNNCVSLALKNRRSSKP